MERVPESYIAALAVNRAGGAFLTSDPTCPPARLNAMLHNASVTVICTQPHLVDLLTPLVPDGTRMVVVDLDDLAGCAPVPPVVSGVRPGDTAYVVYTSGSTGLPKAISVDHEALLNLQVALRQVYRVTPADRVLQWFSSNFDGWHLDVVLGLTAGATLVPAPAAVACVGPVLTRTLRERAVTVALLTPTAWQTVLPADLPDLRLAVAAGEVCPASTAEALSAPGRRVFNVYGPAEAAVWSTWHECRPGRGRPADRSADREQARSTSSPPMVNRSMWAPSASCGSEASASAATCTTPGSCANGSGPTRWPAGPASSCTRPVTSAAGGVTAFSTMSAGWTAR